VAVFLTDTFGPSLSADLASAQAFQGLRIDWRGLRQSRCIGPIFHPVAKQRSSSGSSIVLQVCLAVYAAIRAANHACCQEQKHPF
jgi:hypothetical protein